MEKKESNVTKNVRETVVDVAEGVNEVKMKVSKKSSALGHGASDLLHQGVGAVKDAFSGFKKGIGEVRGKKKKE